mgnify:CR=1 FL=1
MEAGTWHIVHKGTILLWRIRSLSFLHQLAIYLLLLHTGHGMPFVCVHTLIRTHGQQLVVSSLFNNRSIFDDDNAIGIASRRPLVRRNNRGGTGSSQRHEQIGLFDFRHVYQYIV